MQADIHEAEKKAHPIPKEELLRRLVPSTGGCLLWKGVDEVSGYGLLYNRGKYLKIHRVSYMIHRGAIPKGKDVRHTCGVLNCCNPKHLELVAGTDSIKPKEQA